MKTKVVQSQETFETNKSNKIARIEQIIANLSLAELHKLNQAFRKLHQYFYKKYSFKQVENATGINIEQQSLTNLLNLYQRLRTGDNLPEELKKRINAEKQEVRNLLTPAELEFYQIMMDIPLLANHATHSVEKIRDSNGSIYSINQLNLRKLTANKHTPNAHGLRNFTFLSVNLPEEIGIVRFVGQADIYLIDLERYKMIEPASFFGIWSSNHFHAYDTEEIAAPIDYKSANGHTQVFIRYEVKYEPQIIYQRQFIFKRPDCVLQQTFSREEEISAHRHIKPYFILRLIEYIRYFDTDVRKTILQNANNRRLIAKLFNSLFTPGKIELHVPQVLRIGHQSDAFKFLPWTSQIKLSPFLLLDCINDNNLSDLKNYLSQGLSLQFFRTNLMAQRDISLLNYAVLKQRYEMVSLLLQHGADPNHPYEIARSLMECTTRTPLQDAVEMKDHKLIKLLCEPTPSSTPLSINFFAIVSDTVMYAAIAYRLAIDLFDYLLSFYIAHNQSLDNLLLVAVFYEYHQAIKLLLQKGANPNNSHTILRNYDNRHLIPISFAETALTIAAKYGRSTCVQLLLQEGANPNAYIKEEGIRSRFGKGKTPLLVCIDALQSENNFSQVYGQIENCRYEHILKANFNNCIEVINLLLNSGADPYFISGEGESFSVNLKAYLEREPNAALQSLSDSFIGSADSALLPKKDADYHHASYAIITGINDKNESVVLIAIDNKSGALEHAEDKHWSLPGGKANYQLEENLAETLINLTALQTGLDLSRDSIKQDLVSYSNPLASNHEDEILRLSHVILTRSTDSYKLYKNTFEINIIRRLDSPRLKNIQFVELNKIEIQPIQFKNISFPICSYKGMPLPYIASIKIAQLCGRAEFNTAETHQLSTQLHFNGRYLFKQAVKEKDLVIIQSLIKLQIAKFQYLSYFILKAAKKGYYELLSYLLDEGIHLERDQFNHFINSINKVEYREDIILLMSVSHKHFFNNVSLENLAECAGKKGFAKLIDFLKDYNDESLLIKSGGYAFKSLNLGSLNRIFNKIPAPNRKKIAIEILLMIPGNVDLNHAALIKCVLSLLAYDPVNLSSSVLSIICGMYEKIARMEEPSPALQDAYLLLIELMLCSNFFDVQVAIIYGQYIRLIAYKKLEAADAYLKIILQTPIIAILHASRRNLSLELDRLLALHVDNHLVKEALSENRNLIDRNVNQESSDSCFKRAVQANAFPVVKLLLETRVRQGYFDLNKPDKDGKTLLTHAIQAGFSGVAQLLIDYGAKISAADFNYAQADQKLLNFMTSKCAASEYDNKVKQNTDGLEEKAILMRNYEKHGMFKRISASAKRDEISFTPSYS